MHIAFVIDLLAFEGLGATLTSLVRNCSDTQKLTLHFLCSNVDRKHKNNILMLLQTEGFHGESIFYDFDAPRVFGHLLSAHGNWTAYGKFLIPKLVDAEYVLYLDSDLVILLDVLTLSEVRFPNHFLAAVPRGPFRNALDGKFLINKLGVCKDERCFNSGVLLINVKHWNEKNISDEIDNICKAHPTEFLAADQTVLNGLCNGSFHAVDDRYNHLWLPDQEPSPHTENVIFHFAGAPKPWDFFGKAIHSGYKIWSDYDTTFWDRRYKRLTMGKLHRTWKIRRSLIRHYLKILRRMKSPVIFHVNRI